MPVASSMWHRSTCRHQIEMERNSGAQASSRVSRVPVRLSAVLWTIINLIFSFWQNKKGVASNTYCFLDSDRAPLSCLLANCVARSSTVPGPSDSRHNDSFQAPTCFPAMFWTFSWTSLLFPKTRKQANIPPWIPHDFPWSSFDAFGSESWADRLGPGVWRMDIASIQQAKPALSYGRGAAKARLSPRRSKWARSMHVHVGPVQHVQCT